MKEKAKMPLKNHAQMNFKIPCNYVLIDFRTTFKTN